MKIRWREHEMLMVTLMAVIILAAYLRAMHQVSPWQFEAPFTSHHVPFNFYRNVVGPDLGAGLLFYLSYLFVNLFTIRRFLHPKKFEAGTAKISVSLSKLSFEGVAVKIVREYLWLIIQVILVIFLLGSAINVAEYFRHEWLYGNRAVDFLSKEEYALSRGMDLWNAYLKVIWIALLYVLYVILREFLIGFVGNPEPKRLYRTLICNQVSTFFMVYATVGCFILSFIAVNLVSFSFIYLSVIPVGLVFLSNLYWLFPKKRDGAFFRSGIILRLLLLTFLCTVPYAILAGHNTPGVLVSAWLIQLLLVTPLSWVVYLQRKDKILQLRGAETALVKTRADLQFLRSQINPHFLFNVLNTLYGTALQEKAEKTAGGIQKLGDMMRFMLHENHLDFIQMNRELEYLKNYIALQKMRIQPDSGIEITDDLNDEHCNHRIAPMLLIPFTENAFKHGISLREKSWIRIKLTCDEKNIWFEIRNSMHPKQETDPEKERSGIGFRNVLERLKLIYPGRHQITMNADGKEFFVQLAIQPY